MYILHVYITATTQVLKIIVNSLFLERMIYYTFDTDIASLERGYRTTY